VGPDHEGLAGELYLVSSERDFYGIGGSVPGLASTKTS
jgi:hypothetical protein